MCVYVCVCVWLSECVYMCVRVCVCVFVSACLYVFVGGWVFECNSRLIWQCNGVFTEGVEACTVEGGE